MTQHSVNPGRFNLASVHLVVGTVGLVLFILQGQYMSHVLHVFELQDGPRLMYRTGHIYLLLTSALNVCLGVYLPRSPRKLQVLASVLLLVAPLMLIYSFFAESTSAQLHRPVTVYALYIVFAAAVALLLANLFETVKGPKGN